MESEFHRMLRQLMQEGKAMTSIRLHFMTHNACSVVAGNAQKLRHKLGHAQNI